MCLAAPWYRELNIMNRNLTKDFAVKSYSKIEADTFSDVFPPARSVQCLPNGDLRFPAKEF